MAASAPRLLVDDDPQQLQLLCDLLDNAGFVSQQANSGRAAVEQLRTGHWDMIVTDQMMADGDGWFVLRQVRAVGQAVPVVLFPQHCRNVLSSFLADLEFDAMLRKPVYLQTSGNVVGAGAKGRSWRDGDLCLQWQALATLASDGDVSGRTALDCRHAGIIGNGMGAHGPQPPRFRAITAFGYDWKYAQNYSFIPLTVFDG